MLARLFPFLLLACVLATACTSEEDTPAPDAAPDAAVHASPDMHCDSVMYWCENGTVYEGYNVYPNCGGPSTCSAAGHWDPLQTAGTCAHGCGSAECFQCETPNGVTGCYPADAVAELCAP